MGLENFGFNAPTIQKQEVSYERELQCKGHEGDDTSDQMWKEHHQWLKEVEKTRNHTYLKCEWRCEIGLDDSKTEQIIMSTTLERPIKVDESDSYGGCWGNSRPYTSKEANRVVDNILDFFKAQLDLPFKDEGDDHLLRSIKREDVKLLISDKTKAFITKHSGTTWEDLAKNIEDMPEAQVTPEFENDVKEMGELGKDIGKMRDKRIELKSIIYKLLDSHPTQNNIQETANSLSIYCIEYLKITAKFNVIEDKHDALKKKLYHL